MSKVDDDSKVGVVLTQSKKASKKVSKNTIIKVTVGVLDDTVTTMINVVGMNIDKAKNTLNHKNILYKISYQDIDSGEDNIVLKQSISPNSKIKNGQTVTLVISRLNKKENATQDDSNNSEEESQKSNDLEDNE